ncbi:MAG: helix-turn-helix domain-containing protein [Treponema sp.]|nr:helix-turn-helix domain-containing protein [Lachnospiraceae bacterium]MCQ2598155.1 helix-turn-helix domain-containing protein [Treponema sp.]
MNQLLKAEDVANILQVKTAHIYQMKARHEIPFIKIGGSIRFDSKQIEEWIENKKSTK